MSRPWPWLVAPLLPWLASGCASTPPQTHYYQLALAESAAARPTGGDIVLVIEPLAVDEAYASDRIVYRQSSYRLDYYHYHRWSAAPAAQVTDFLRRAFAATGKFALVTFDPAARGVLLRGRLGALEEVDASPTEWLGRVALELSLYDIESGELLWAHAFTEEEPLERRNPEGLAHALSVALSRIARQSSAAIAAAAAARPRGFDAPERRGAP